MKNLLFLYSVYILFITEIYAKESLPITKHTIMTVEKVKVNSKEIEDKILHAKVLNFEDLKKHESVLVNYFLTEENIAFMQKVVDRSIELYGVDSLETQVTYLYLAYAYLLNQEMMTADTVYEYVEETKENTKYEKNKTLEEVFLDVKILYAVSKKEYQKAKQLMLSQLALIKKEHEPEKYILALTDLIGWENILKENKNALKHIEEIKILMKNKNLKLTHKQRVEIQIVICNTYSDAKKYDEILAEVDIAFKEIEKTDEGLISLLGWKLYTTMALLSMRMEDYNIFKKTVNEMIYIQDQLHIYNISKIYLNYSFLATVEMIYGNHKKALEISQKLLKMVEKSENIFLKKDMIQMMHKKINIIKKSLKKGKNEQK